MVHVTLTWGAQSPRLVSIEILGGIMAEYSIPIMFDVIAATEAGAAARLVDVLVDAQLTSDGDGRGGVDSWWTIEAGHKQFDGNDNDAGEVIFSTDPPAEEPGRYVWVVTYVRENDTGGVSTAVDVYGDEHSANVAAAGATGDGYFGATVTRRVVL